MAHEVIPIPGDGTGVSAGARINFEGVADQDLSVTLTYNVHSKHLLPLRCGVLTFTGVFEFRWVTFFATEVLPNKADFEFKLIRITNSEEIDRLRARGRYPESTLNRLHHYRIGWDDWGSIDIISTDLTIGETSDDCP